SSNIATLINGLTYQNTSQDPTSGARTVTLTQIVDTGGTASGGVDTTGASIAATVNVTAVNDAPTLSATGNTTTFTEDGAAQTLFSSALVSTVEAGQAIQSLTFTVGNIQNGSSEILSVDGSTISLINGSGTTATNGMSYSVTVSGGTATIVLSKVAGVSSSNIATLINGLTYQNTSQDPTSGARRVTLTQIVDTGGTASGGVDTTGASIAATVNVTPVNDAPTLSATGRTTTFTEDGAAQTLFSGALVSTVESGQTIKSLTFTVGNIQNGSSEILSVDGSTISLINGSGTTTANGMSYSVTVSGGTATVVLSKVSGVSSSNIATLINGLTYQNTSQDPTSGARTVTLTQIVDTGGTASGGVDTTGTPIAATVNVIAVNDAPILSGPSQTISYVGHDSAKIIDTTITVSDIDNPAHFDGGYLQVAITTGVTASDQLSVVPTGNGATQIKVSGNHVMYGGVAIGTVDSIMNGKNGHELKISFNANASSAAVEALARSIGFSNNANIPSTANRTVIYEFHDGGNIGIGGDLIAYKANTIAVLNVPNPPGNISIPAMTGGAINMDEVLTRGGSEMNISLDGTGAIAGDMLTINWGSKIIVYSLANADITANNAEVLIPTSAVLAEGDGKISVTAKITNRFNKTSELSSPATAIVDTYIAGVSTDAQTVSNSNNILLTGKLLGTAQAGDLLTVQVSNLIYKINLTAGARNWSVLLPVNLPAGTYGILTTLTDTAGNIKSDMGAGKLIVEADTFAVPVPARMDPTTASVPKSISAAKITTADSARSVTSNFISTPGISGTYSPTANVNSILSGFSQTVNALLKNQNDVTDSKNVLSSSYVKPLSYSGYETIENVELTANKTTSKTTSEMEALNALENTTSSNKSAEIVKEAVEGQKNAAGKKTNFQEKIKNLLKDFGIDE
ncbi:MAG TPA: hypothetical protein VLI69_00150, partial [Gammaproteobacteria bacterium]|nr:hypothetical protein [Gammaproteobacteria bacterium]